jgi:hypothetical protein
VDALASSKEVKEGARDEQRLVEWQSSYEEPALRAIAQITNGGAAPEVRAAGVHAAEELSAKSAKEHDEARQTALRRALGAVTIGAYEAANRTRQSGDNTGTAALYDIIAAAQPENPDALYNVACGFALLGDKKKALRVLQKATAAGFHDLETLSHDKDLDSLRSEPEFQELVKKTSR